MRPRRVPTWRFALSLVCVAAAPASAQPAGWGLPQLMQSLAQVKSAAATVTERKTLKILNAPLLASGTLAYTAPDQMQKITVSPMPERFILNGQHVALTDGPDNQTHVFSLAQDPRIGGLITGIIATLAGDLPTLSRSYNIQLLGSPNQWQLLLQPKDQQIAQLIAWIRINGAQNRIDEINTQANNGDHSEMSVTETIIDAR
jgi:outer membrane lipoprotein-sorting protein